MRRIKTCFISPRERGECEGFPRVAVFEITSRALNLILLSAFYLTCADLPFAQESSYRSLTLNAAVDLALRNYPAVRAAQAQALAATSGVDLARTAYLPRTDLLWQGNRATRNNILGMLLPQSVIPPISGPVLGTRSFASAWGSAAGLLFSWEPFDFGLRKAKVDVAQAASDRAHAELELTRLDVAAAAANAFLRLLAAEQTVRAAKANVERMEAFARYVHALADNQLRPGADASRADAELAAARNQLIVAEQEVEISRATLAEALGLAGAQVTIDPGPLLDLPPDTKLAAPDIESHPLAAAQAAALEAVRARERALDRSYLPRFNFQFAIYGRGSGALVDGGLDANKGLVPEVPNWAAGLQMNFPLFDIFEIRARRRIEANNEILEQARYEQTLQRLKAEQARARALVDGALRMARNTPIQLGAAREAEARARARYEAGLTTVVEVAEAQRLLAQAEIEDALARLGVWRALLEASRAQGDLRPFLQQVLNASAQRRKQHVAN